MNKTFAFFWSFVMLADFAAILLVIHYVRTCH